MKCVFAEIYQHSVRQNSCFLDRTEFLKNLGIRANSKDDEIVFYEIYRSAKDLQDEINYLKKLYTHNPSKNKG